MRLHRKILAGAERAADAGHGEADSLRRQTEDTGQLLLVHVQPLRRDEEVHASLAVGDCKARLRAQRRLVLHADLVLAGDDDLRACVRVAMADLHLPRDVAVGMQSRRIG